MATTQKFAPLFEYVEIKNAETKAATIKVMARGKRVLKELFLFFIAVPKALQ